MSGGGGVMPMRTELGILAVTAAFSFVMMIQWLSKQYAPNFVGYFLVFFTATVILQGSIPDWLFERIHRRPLQPRSRSDGLARLGEDGNEEDDDNGEGRIVADMALYRMINVVFANWSIWLLCGAMEVFTWAFVRMDRPVEIAISVVMVIAVIAIFGCRRFLLSEDFPRPALVLLYGSYYALCIIPVSYNNALLSSTGMTALRQVYYIYICLLYFYLVPARNRTSRASSMVATTHLIYPLYGHWMVLALGLVPAFIMTYMSARKIRPYVKTQLRIFNDKLERIRGSRDVFDFAHQEETVLDDDDADYELHIPPRGAP